LTPLGLFLEPPGLLLTHLHTVYMAYSKCLPTRLNPLAERTCFSQVWSSAAAPLIAAVVPQITPKGAMPAARLATGAES
jgi:hypothetical protein